MKLAIYKTADSKINRNQLLINIPSGEFNTSICSDQFTLFVELLQPYLTTLWSVTQQQLNQLTDAIGYYNYIMTDGMILSEEDKKRRNRLLKSDLSSCEITTPKGVLLVKLIEPPCTGRYARWCERSGKFI